MPWLGLGGVRNRALGVEGAAACGASEGRIRGPQRACWSPQISVLGPQEETGRPAEAEQRGWRVALRGVGEGSGVCQVLVSYQVSLTDWLVGMTG